MDKAPALSKEEIRQLRQLKDPNCALSCSASDQAVYLSKSGQRCSTSQC